MKIKRLNEAHYGGAFDIADDQYFTREDVDNATEKVLDHISETFKGEYHIGGSWVENGKFIVNIQDNDYNEYEAEVPVDMRKIKRPTDLNKYALDVASKIIAQIKDNTSVNESFTMYSISNREHEQEVDKLIKEYQAQGWNPWDSKYSGSKYYVILARRGEDGKGEFKAIQYSNQLFPRVIDITYKQAQGYEPIDDFDGLRRDLGRMLLPKREGMDNMKENTFTDKIARFKKAFDFGVEGYKAGLKVGGAHNPEFLKWVATLKLPLASKEQLRILDEYNKGWMKANLDNWDEEKGEEIYSVGSGKKIAVEPIDEDVRLAPTNLKSARKTYNVSAFEKDLLTVDNVVDVDFDLDMYEELSQVIVLTKYSIPFNDDNWYGKRKKIKKDVIKIAKQHGLVWSGDSIEDYGDWLYFVFDEPMTKNEAWSYEPTYDSKDGWTDADIELHKTTDWKARNYVELPVPEDNFMHTAVAYTDEGVRRKSCKFIKYIRANSIFPPYYKPETDPFENVVGPIYDGEDHNGYGIHNRYESQEVYDALFDNWKRNGKKLSEGLEDRGASEEFLERACVIALQALINDGVEFPTGRYSVDGWQEWIEEIRMGCPGGFILEDAECIRDFLEANGKFEDELEYLEMMIGKFVKYHPIDESKSIDSNETKLDEGKQGFIKNHGDCRILYVGSTYVVTDNKGLNIGESPTMSGAEAIADEHSKKPIKEDIDEGHEVYGSWSVDFTITLEGEEVRFDDLSEVSQEHIADLIREGYVSGEVCESDYETDDTNYGWWSISRELYLDDVGDVRWDDLDDASQEHVAEMIKDGYTSGELCVWREGDESLPSEFNMDTEIIDYVDLDDEDEVNDAIIEFALETFDREPDRFDFAINGSVIEVTNIVWGATNESLSEAKSNRKISLYINGEYICSSTQYSSCKEFVDKVKADGKVEYQGLKGAGTGKVTKEIKDSDKVTARFGGSMKEAVLVEEPVITLNDDDIMNPSEVNFKKKIAQATAEEEEAKKKAALDARKAEMRTKYQGLLDKVSSMPKDEGDNYDRLEALFDELVPRQGKATSVAGELVRAVTRLIYRYYNDGDVFYWGYGLETCASSAAYLADRYDSIIQSGQAIGEKYAREYDMSPMDGEYEQFLRDLSEKVVEDILFNPELIAEENTVDSRDYDADWLVDEQPRFDYDFMLGDGIEEMLEADIVSNRDVESYVEDCLQWESTYDGVEVSYDGGDYVYVSELTHDGFEALQDRLKGNGFDHFWEEFINDHQDELDALRDQEDEEYDDDFEDEE